MTKPPIDTSHRFPTDGGFWDLLDGVKDCLAELVDFLWKVVVLVWRLVLIGIGISCLAVLAGLLYRVVRYFFFS